MRVLLYGMQSSGASVLALTLAQKPASLAFIDIWNMFAAPELETQRDSVAKVVVTSAFSLEVHRQRFRPDVTILVLRHPVDTYYSLKGKSYANESGLIDEKFAILEKIFLAGKGFDQVAYYEDFVFSPRGLIDLCNDMGWKITCDALLFARTHRDIQATNAAECPGIHERLKYGIGNVNTRGMLRDRVKFSKPWGKTSHLPRLCPSLLDHYSAVRADRGTLWRLPSPALLSCSLETILRELTKSNVIPEQSERSGYRLRLTGGNSQCRVGDTGVVLCPGRRQEPHLTVSGLPSRPFNRISGIAYAEHPRALGTTTSIRVERANGDCLVEQEFTLCHSDMRFIDLAFEPQQEAIALSLGVRLADGVNSAAHAAVCIQNLRLEQTANR